MRISNEHRTVFKSVLTDAGLNLKQFDITGDNDLFYVKYKFDYFDFRIKMVSSNKYSCHVKSVNDTSAHGYEKHWVDLIALLKGWAVQIAKDIEHSTTKFENQEEDFPPIIKKHCRKFILIYNQALTAEGNGLTEICGLGYRKAFEFLIKDYLLKKNPKTEHDNIRSLQIYPCIDKYVTSDEIKLLSHRVLWLGNDHAHYIKIWKNKSLTDLKHLISLTIKWIENHEAVLKIKKTMPEGRNKSRNKKPKGSY